jgi:potassium efflux system protein
MHARFKPFASLFALTFAWSWLVLGRSLADTGSPDSSAPTLAESVPGDVTVADLERRRSDVDELQGLSTEVRSEIVDQYTKAIERLESAAKLTTQFQALEAEAAKAPDDLSKLEKLASTDSEQQPEAIALPDGPEALRALYLEAETAVAETKKRLAALTTEIERRTARTRELPQLIADGRSHLDSLVESLAAPAVTGEPAELTTARRLRLEATRRHRLAEMAVLEQEVRTYAATDRVLTLERERLERAANDASGRLAAMTRAVAEQEQRDAEARAEEARTAAVLAHPAVREAAGVNTMLAEKHAKLVEEGKEARLELERIESLRIELGQQYAETRKRAEESKFSPAIGLLLRSQQAELPDTSAYRKRAIEREERQAEINLELLQWETERRRLQNADETVAGYIDGIRGDIGLAEQLDVREELKEVFQGRVKLYGDLIAHARSQLGRLAALQSAEDGLIQVVDDHRTFIAEHVLWVRSTTPLTPAVLPLIATAAGELLDPAAWFRAAQALLADVRDQPLIELLLVPVIWIIAIRRRLSAKLESLAHDASRSTSTGFRPTLEAIAVSAALALPWPAVMLFCGWRLTAAGPGGDLAHALGTAFVAGAAAFGAVNLAIAVCLPKGLGEAHFGWDRAVTAALRRALQMARAIALPAGLVVLLSEAWGDDLLVGTVGRLALVAGCLALAFITQRLFRRSGPVEAMLTHHHPGAWFQLMDRAVTRLLVFVPIVLAGLSLAGYHYTAVRISWRVSVTWGVFGLGIVVRALIMRWLAIVHSRLTLRRARERRATLAARQEAGNDAPAEMPRADDRSLQLPLSDIEDQARRLVQLTIAIAGVGCLAMIWHDIVPAVGYLSRFTLWQSSVSSGGEAGSLVRITLVEAMLAVIGVIVTVLACRNLPGVLDLAVFQRLPLDAGARYAATAVTQYVVAAGGAVLCFRQIGISWQNVQWLVAAMTVGLGFGLQEIFANFVSGLILLFERPIRVGDVVTIGDVTGTVTRIRIRATTVCDWDHKELIVPNREFVTGKLVNWTLTNPNLRVVIRVGIAYGSDTRLATRLLEEAAQAHPLTLPDPPPTAVFTSFGESSLDFELRVFTTGVINTRILRHELHLAIDDAFRNHGIEIAFPQRELHVKGLPTHWHEQNGELQPATEADPAKTPKRRVA